MSKRTKELTAANLKDELWGVLQDLRAKKIGSDVASASAQVAHSILNVAKFELEVSQLESATQGIIDFTGQIQIENESEDEQSDDEETQEEEDFVSDEEEKKVDKLLEDF